MAKGKIVFAELRKVSGDLDGHRVQLRVNPDIALALKTEARAVLKEIEQMLDRAVTLRPDAQLHHEQFDVMAM